MNIVLLTNTYTPHVGGVARSVAAFAAEYRRLGHRVLVVAPRFPRMPAQEVDVVRIPALQNFNASDFSVVLPVSALLTDTLDRFQPDIVHSQHPFLLGMTALRIARYRSLPLVFTHHTLYERYTHYVPGDSPALKRFVVELATRYANLTDRVFAPSEGIRDLLRDRGVAAPIAVIPTGVDSARFATGDGPGFRRSLGIPSGALVVGHLGRLAPEKNLDYLATAVAEFAGRDETAHFLAVGTGPSAANIRAIFAGAGLGDRLHRVGQLEQPRLADALHAMDLFAFASTSETQGMVLTEAMAAGLPVLALDATGAHDLVRDGVNGRLLPATASSGEFAAALRWLADRPAEARRQMRDSARQTAARFSIGRTAGAALNHYQALLARPGSISPEAVSGFEQVMRLIKAEWDILKTMKRAGDAALGGGRSTTRRPR